MVGLVRFYCLWKLVDGGRIVLKIANQKPPSYCLNNLHGKRAESRRDKICGSGLGKKGDPKPEHITEII